MPLFPGLEDGSSGVLCGLVEALDLLEVDLLVETVLEAQVGVLEGLTLGGTVASAVATTAAFALRRVILRDFIENNYFWDFLFIFIPCE